MRNRFRFNRGREEHQLTEHLADWHSLGFTAESSDAYRSFRAAIGLFCRDEGVFAKTTVSGRSVHHVASRIWTAS